MRVTQAGDRFRALTLSAVASLLTASWTFSVAATAVACPELPEGSVERTTWVIFVDDLHLEFRNTGRLRTLLKTIASELFHEGDAFGIVSSGPSSIAIDVTSDRQVIEAAIKKASGNGLRLSDIRAGPGTIEVGYRARVALATATDAIRNLQRLPQRKALIYVSNGYDSSLLPGSPVAARTPPPSRPPRDISAPRASPVRELLRELPHLASRAGVTIFAIDARILDVTPLLDPNVDRVAWQRHLTNTRDTLRAIAEGAGGFAVVDAGDLDASLKRISRTMHD